MGRLFKYLLYLAVLAALAFAGYALVAELPAPVRTITFEAPDAGAS
jgi:hypothetical protein